MIFTRGGPGELSGAAVYALLCKPASSASRLCRARETVLVAARERQLASSMAALGKTSKSSREHNELSLKSKVLFFLAPLET